MPEDTVAPLYGFAIWLFYGVVTGMGSFTAVGGLKAGEKHVTAFETEDCGTALAVAKFKAFAKPGGSRYVVSVA